MPGIRLVSTLAPQATLDAAAAAARRQGYAVRPDSGDLIVRKGNLAAGLLLGALFPYCDFRLYLEREQHGNVTLTIQRNEPSRLLAGGWSVNQIVRRSEELADAIAQTIRAQGGDLLSRETF